MNILLASVDALPAIGGISLMAHHLANALARAGHRVVLLGPRGMHVPADLARDYLLCEDWESETARQAGSDSATEDARIATLAAGIFVRYGIERVVLVHAFYYGPGLIDACRMAGIPCSVLFHGLELRSQLARGYPTRGSDAEDWGGDTLSARTYRVIARCDELLANSRYTAHLLEPLRARAPIRVIGCGIEEGELERAVSAQPQYDARVKQASRVRLGFSEVPTLAFVGRLVSNKRVDRLIDLVAQVPALAALIIGSGPQAEALQHRANALGIAARVRFSGPVPTDRKWELLAASDAIALLSDDDPVRGSIEGFGIALLEGIAAGCVPITSGTGGMGDIVTEVGRDGLVLPLDGNVAEQAAMLTALLADEARTAGIVAEARRQLAGSFTWEHVAARLVDGWIRETAAA